MPLSRLTAAHTHFGPSHVHYAEKRTRYRADARRLPARQRSARLHHAAYRARRDDRRARSPLPRVHGERTGHRARAAQLPAARLSAVSEGHLHLGQRCDVPRHPRRQGAEKRRRAEYRRHRHQGRLFRRHQPHVPGRRGIDPGEAPRADHVRLHVARHRQVAPARISATSARRSRNMPKRRATAWCASTAATASGSVPRRSAGAALRPPRHGHRTAGRA